MSADLRDLREEIREGAIHLVDLLRRMGAVVEVTSVLRSRAKQRKLYREYRAGRSVLPAAKPGESLHEYGLAFDVLFHPVARYQAKAGALWTRWGGVWGGKSDPVHFQLRMG